MNWYFEVEGVSRGPFPEGEFEHMVRRREVPEDSLVWRPGMEEWATVGAVHPVWLSAPAAEARPQAKAAKTAAPAARSVAPADELPVIEAAVPVEAAPPARAPEQSKLKPQAPTPAAEPPAGAKGGILKRVFGFGGKKK